MNKQTFLSVKDEVRYQMISSLNRFWKIPCLHRWSWNYWKSRNLM